MFRNQPLSDYCTFRIGGPAKYFRIVDSEEAMRQALAFAQTEQIPWIVIGKGSNCLFDDLGFDGLVILNKITGIQDQGNGRFQAGAGHSFAHLGVTTARQGWSGLEFASGIPASVGGAVVMNAGANGTETCETLVEVAFMHPDGTTQNYSRGELHYSYRHSPFLEWKGAVLGATFQLKPSATARETQIAIVNKRLVSQPYNDPSAGCVFRNPEGNSAGALIDRLGLKGLRVGDAEVSPIHANFVVNRGNARASDVLELLKQVEDKIRDANGISLQREVRVIPFQLKMD